MNAEIVNTGDNASNAGVSAEATDNIKASKKSGKRLRLLCDPQKLPEPPRMATRDEKGMMHCEGVEKELRDFFYHSIMRASRRRNR